MNTAATKTFEITLGADKWTTRETQASVLAMLAGRGLTAKKRGYTTWCVYENGIRVGLMDDLG